MVSEWPSTVMVWQFCADPRGALGLALDGGGGAVAAPGRGALGAGAPGGAYGGGEEYARRVCRRHDVAAGQSSRGQAQEQRHGHGPRHAGTTRSEELALMGASLNSLDCPG